MPPMKPKALILCDENDAAHLDMPRDSEHWSTSWLLIDYDKFDRSLPSIQKEIKHQGIDFIVFSRNDQVAKRIMIGPIIRKLRIGYTSFSGLDEIDRVSQMKDCFSAFMEGDKQFSYENSPMEHGVPNETIKGTFTIVFDVEQVGCIRVGLPRILKLLDRYGVKSTFFLTNIMNHISPDLVPTLTTNLHEVGVHGKWHEYLSDSEPDIQSRYLAEAKEDMGCSINGVNFLYRMNRHTVDALSQNHIDYFVAPMINTYKFYQYPKISTSPAFISSSNGDVLMIPISVETYGKPWFTIKNMIDTAYSISQKQGKHITILCHPFREGNARNIQTTERLIKYLVITKKMRPITLRELKDQAKIESTTDHIEFQDDFSVSGRISQRMTAMDIAGLLPENAFLMWKFAKYPHAVW